jgi:hypothetical protein
VWNKSNYEFCCLKGYCFRTAVGRLLQNSHHYEQSQNNVYLIHCNILPFCEPKWNVKTATHFVDCCQADLLVRCTFCCVKAMRHSCVHVTDVELWSTSTRFWILVFECLFISWAKLCVGLHQLMSGKYNLTSELVWNFLIFSQGKLGDVLNFRTVCR